MSTETLFTLSIDQRREGYVRKQFGQGDVFGRETISEFVSFCAELTNFYTLSPGELQLFWKLVSERGVEHHCVNEYATPFEIDENIVVPTHWVNLPESVYKIASQTFTLIHAQTSIRTYWGLKDIIALLEVRHETGAVSHHRMCVPKEFWSLPAFNQAVRVEFGASDADRLEVIIAEWYRNRPKAAIAREFCLERMRNCIVKARVKAETEFDSAVAVSSDGRQIVHADEVRIGRYAFAHFLGPMWEPVTTIPAAACTEHKVLRLDGDLPRYKDDIVAMSSNGKQGLILNSFGKRIFFTTPDLCPPELLMQTNSL